MNSLILTATIMLLCAIVFIPVLADDAKDKEWCITTRDKYDIKPGKSFGNLPVSMHNQYLKVKCHRFFCKPHPLADKGVYECEPLDS